MKRSEIRAHSTRFFGEYEEGIVCVITEDGKPTQLTIRVDKREPTFDLTDGIIESDIPQNFVDFDLAQRLVDVVLSYLAKDGG